MVQDYAFWREHMIAWLSKCVRGLHFPMLGFETGLEREVGKTASTLYEDLEPSSTSSYIRYPNW